MRASCWAERNADPKFDEQDELVDVASRLHLLDWPNSTVAFVQRVDLRAFLRLVDKLERRRDFPVMTKPNGLFWRFLVLLSGCLTLTYFTCSVLGTCKVDWHVMPVISTFYALFDSIYAPFFGLGVHP